MSNIMKVALTASIAAGAANAAHTQDIQSHQPITLTAAFPVAVAHSDPSMSPRGWNEGFLHNPGIIISAVTPIAKLGDTADVFAGATFGVYKNSIFRTTMMAGLDIGIEKRFGKFAFDAGLAIGGVSGYTTKVNIPERKMEKSDQWLPAVAPMASLSREIFPRVSLGLQGRWLPAKTLHQLFKLPGKGIADAYTSEVTLSYKF